MGSIGDQSDAGYDALYVNTSLKPFTVARTVPRPRSIGDVARWCAIESCITDANRDVRCMAVAVCRMRTQGQLSCPASTVMLLSDRLHDTAALVQEEALLALEGITVQNDLEVLMLMEEMAHPTRANANGSRPHTTTQDWQKAHSHSAHGSASNNSSSTATLPTASTASTTSLVSVSSVNSTATVEPPASLSVHALASTVHRFNHALHNKLPPCSGHVFFLELILQYCHRCMEQTMQPWKLRG